MWNFDKFRSNLQIPRKIVKSAENTKIRDFYRDPAFWRAVVSVDVIHIMYIYPFPKYEHDTSNSVGGDACSVLRTAEHWRTNIT